MSITLTDEERLALLESELGRRQADEERESLSASLKEFVGAAWKVLKPAEPYHHNWHIAAICEHLEAVSEGEIKRLQIWIPRRDDEVDERLHLLARLGVDAHALSFASGRRLTSWAWPGGWR